MSSHPGFFSRRGATLAAAAFGALLAPAVAHAADATATNHAYSCIPNGAGEASKVTISKDGNTVTAKASNSGTTTVLCPITIKNSGPAVVANDGIKSISLKTTGTVKCNILTRRAPVLYADRNLNDVAPSYQASKTTSTPTTWTFNTSTSRPQNYWHAGNYTADGTPGWYYSYLSCDLSPGAVINGDYTTTEYGPATGYTIDPMWTCALATDLPWVFDEVFHNPPGGPGQDRTGGFIRAQASGTARSFSLTCPSIPANSSIQVMTSSPGLPSGCNLNNSNLSTVTWYQDNYNAQFPIAVIPQAWTPVIETPAQGTSTMYCGGVAPAGSTLLLGDDKWQTYRVSPNVSRASTVTTPGPWGKWKGTASVNNSGTDAAFDNDGGTRWTSNGPGKKGMWFDVDLGANWANLEFNQITFDSGSGSPDDYPRAFTVLLSYDDTGKNFFPLISGTSNNHQSSLNFSEQGAKHVRIQVDQDIKVGTTTKYWSIRELNLYFNNGSN
jgi:hypothetical protein